MSVSVLVVDDDAALREFVGRVLTGWGHVVIGEAATVAEALERAAELRPDTVLVDLRLPDGDGFALTRQLVALPWPVRVVVISSDGDPANVPAARGAGACGFVPKEELTGQALRRLLEAGRAPCP